MTQVYVRWLPYWVWTCFHVLSANVLEFCYGILTCRKYLQNQAFSFTVNGSRFSALSVATRILWRLQCMIGNGLPEVSLSQPSTQAKLFNGTEACSICALIRSHTLFFVVGIPSANCCVSINLSLYGAICVAIAHLDAMLLPIEAHLAVVPLDIKAPYWVVQLQPTGQHTIFHTRLT